MKYLIILCLPLALTGCFGSGPYASANGPAYGPVPDLGACARSPEPTTRETNCATGRTPIHTAQTDRSPLPGRTG